MAGPRKSTRINTVDDSTATVAVKIPSAPVGLVERNPSNWSISSHSDGVQATCSATGRVYVGAMEGLNKILRGEE
jgi:hypothetical protein